ncbi:MAG TPA: sugar phosphate isomerase/epimerase family protein [Armatimonadota bacterium]|jgi:sugar phosphate isomerase/epimerase
MQVSIRDNMVEAAQYESLVAGLKDLELSRFELEVHRDSSVLSLGSFGEGARVRLDNPAAIAEYAKALRDAGLQVCALLLSNNFNAPDLGGEVDFVVDCIRLAHTLGAGAVRIDSAMRDVDGWTLEQRRDRFAECLHESLDRTAAQAIPLGVENHGHLGNNVEFLRSVADQVGSPLLGVTLDTANWYWYGFPLSRVYEIHREMAPLVKHTHIKNIRFPVETRETQREIGWKYGDYAAPIPDGDIDHRISVGYLYEHRYQGDLCIEDESLFRMDSEARKEALRRDSEYVRELAREFA